MLKCDDRNKKAQCMNRIADIRQLLCSDIAPRVLIPTLSDSCDSLIQSTNPVNKFFLLLSIGSGKGFN